jgi:hypothetical protein
MMPSRLVSVSNHIVPSGEDSEGLLDDIVGRGPGSGWKGLASTTVPAPEVTDMLGTTLTIAIGMEFAGIVGSAPGDEEENVPVTATSAQLAVLSPGSVTCATM